MQKPTIKRMELEQQLEDHQEQSGMLFHDLNYRNQSTLQLAAHHNQSNSMNYGTIDYFSSQPSRNVEAKGGNLGIVKSTSTTILPAMNTSQGNMIGNPSYHHRRTVLPSTKPIMANDLIVND